MDGAQTWSTSARRYHHAAAFEALDAAALKCVDGVWRYDGDRTGPTYEEAGSVAARRHKSDREPLPTLADFVDALDELRRIAASGPVKSFSFKRLAVLEQRFNLHVLLNGWRELAAQKAVPHRDFYNVRKVDAGAEIKAKRAFLMDFLLGASWRMYYEILACQMVDFGAGRGRCRCRGSAGGAFPSRPR